MRLKKDSALRIERGAFLRPLYEPKGDIVVRLGVDCDVYERGGISVETSASGDTWTLERVSCLLRWESWLRRARVGTLRWLAAQEGQLGAGEVRSTASVLSQLRNAGLVKPSDLWGDSVSEDGYRLSLWAAFELDRRGS